jgi:hypothetical protein
MSSKTRMKSEAESRGTKAAAGFVIQTRILVSAAATGAAVVSTAAALALSPAASSVVAVIGEFALHNPVLLGLVALFAVGHSSALASWTNSGKPGKNGNTGVACTRCNSVFGTQREMERHSSGYHI